MKSATLILTLLLLIAAATTFAQQRGRRGFGGAPDVIAQTRDALSLSPQQVTRLRALLAERRQAEQAAQDNVQAKLDAVAAIQEKTPPDPSGIQAAGPALRQAEQAQRSISDRFNADFIALLTPAQKKTFDTLNAAAASVGALSRLGVIGNGRGGPGGRGLGVPPFGFPGAGAPRGRGALRSPPTNPLTPEKVALGKQLFFDTRLSADGTLSCASCHDPEKAFADGRVVARGVHGLEGSRNAPALIEAGFSRSFFWDGRAPTLERQVLQPILNPKELGLTEAELEQKTQMKSADISDALASYVRTIRSTDSRYDRYQRGDATALNDLERAGLEVFRGRGRCAGCHAGPDLTDSRFHNTGVAWSGGRFTDEGRFTITLNPRDHGAFKTPTLREVSRTAPYMHDGSLATLEAVVDFYDRGGHRNPYIDPRVRRIGLSSGERSALVAFLKTLSGQIHDGL
jgi:cytochrome c peroxidase